MRFVRGAATNAAAASSALHRSQRGGRYRRRAAFHETRIRNSCDQRSRRERDRRCALLLSNDVRAERGFDEPVRFVPADAGVPYDWEYGDRAGKS